MSTLSDLLERAKPYGLELEVCISVIEYIEEVGSTSVSEAVDAAIREWDL